MEISTTNTASSLLTSLGADNAAGIYMLKKVAEIEKQSAEILINSLEQAAAAVDPSKTLGRNIDVKV